MKPRKFIRINKLFGKYDNEIDLSSRAIIFIGENGVGKTTIMKILQALMNFNFSELIKYDFESIDIEVSAKNGKIIKDTIKYEDLLPSDEEIKESIMKSEFFYKNLHDEWDAYKDLVSDEEKIQSFDDDSMTDEEKIEIWNDFDFDKAYDYCEVGNFDDLANEVLKDLIKRKELRNIIRKIIKKEEFSNLYYDDYINKINYNDEEKYYWFNKDHSHICWQYDDIEKVTKNIINIIKEFLEKRLTSNPTINFTNKKNIIRIINIINDDIDKPIDILDMTKVYNFENEVLTSSLITHELLEWKAALPTHYKDYKPFPAKLKNSVYSIVLEELKDNIAKYENKSKDISELNSPNIIEINSIINHYYYNEDFIIYINEKALEYYKDNIDVYNFIYNEHVEEDKIKIKDRFNKYIRPIILRNSLFDAEFYTFKYTYDTIFCDFCIKEWHLIEENINPKIKTLQQLLDKYMMNKSVEVTPMGLLIKSKEDNQNIPLNSLSSGEKKLLVIFMHCLFNEDVPIIIDEPEISLSIIWQENLLPDLLEKTNIKQIIVATHSAAVISDTCLDKYIIPLPNSIVDKGENTNE